MEFPEIMKRTKAEVEKRLLAKKITLVIPRKELSIKAKLDELAQLEAKLASKSSPATTAQGRSSISNNIASPNLSKKLIATDPIIPDLMDA